MGQDCVEIEDWVENFRMRKETFNYLCDKLCSTLSVQTHDFGGLLALNRG